MNIVYFLKEFGRNLLAWFFVITCIAPLYIWWNMLYMDLDKIFKKPSKKGKCCCGDDCKCGKKTE